MSEVTFLLKGHSRPLVNGVYNLFAERLLPALEVWQNSLFVPGLP